MERGYLTMNIRPGKPLECNKTHLMAKLALKKEVRAKVEIWKISVNLYKHHGGHGEYFYILNLGLVSL